MEFQHLRFIYSTVWLRSESFPSPTVCHTLFNLLICVFCSGKNPKCQNKKFSLVFYSILFDTNNWLIRLSEVYNFEWCIVVVRLPMAISEINSLFCDECFRSDYYCEMVTVSIIFYSSCSICLHFLSIINHTSIKLKTVPCQNRCALIKPRRAIRKVWCLFWYPHATVLFTVSHNICSASPAPTLFFNISDYYSISPLNTEVLYEEWC